MHLSYILASFAPLLHGSGVIALKTSHPTNLFSNPSASSAAYSRIPSVRESAVQARRILSLQNIATFSTVLPPLNALEQRPEDVAGAPIGLMEYYAQCGSRPYDPIILGVTIATTMKNAAAGSNVTLAARYHVPSNAPPSNDPWLYLPANLPRISLVGYIEKLSDEEIKKQNVTKCFFETHPDATIWAPGGADVPHESWWGRLVINEVYFFGGFGDRARIGWIPIDIWRGITQEEVAEYRMPGEKGYKERELHDHEMHTWEHARNGQQELL